MAIGKPEALNDTHDLTTFDCGNEALNRWLRKWALHNQRQNATKTQVITAEGSVVVGFYSLAAGEVTRAKAPGRISRNQPEPIPVIVLGRLAIDVRYQGRGLGGDLLQHAYQLSCIVARSIGVRAMMVTAKDENAANFYKRWGFQASMQDSLLLFRKSL